MLQYNIFLVLYLCLTRPPFYDFHKLNIFPGVKKQREGEAMFMQSNSINI